MMSSRGYASIVLCASLALLTACSNAVLVTEKPNSDRSGLSYYLPKSLVEITLKPLGIKKDKPVANLTPEELQRAGTKGFARVPIFVGGKRYYVLVNKDGKLQHDLITGLQLELSGEERIPDTEFGYVLNYRQNPLYSDRVCIGTTDDGLLKLADAQVKDQTSNIVISLAKFGGRLAGPDAFAGVPIEEFGNARDVTIKIDPFNRDDLQAVEQAIHDNFPSLRGRYSLEIKGGKHFGIPPTNKKCPDGRICYRTLVPIRIGLNDKKLGYTQTLHENVVNISTTVSVDVTRAFLVEKLTRLVFDRGVLTRVIMKKPSEGLAAAKLPLTVYDAIVTSALAAPGEFLGKLTPGTSVAAATSILETQVKTLSDISSLQLSLAQIREETETGKPEPDNETLEIFQNVCPQSK